MMMPPDMHDPFKEMMAILGVTREVATREWEAANRFEYSRLKNDYWTIHQLLMSSTILLPCMLIR